MGTSVVVRGVSQSMTQFFLRGTIQESNRLVCRVKDAKVKVISEHRHDFRLHMGIPVALYQRSDTSLSNPEECTLVDFVGEIIRVAEYEPGKFRYGFLFAQLAERDLTELTRTLYNIQVGNRTTWMRTDSGRW